MADSDSEIEFNQQPENATVGDVRQDREFEEHPQDNEALERSIEELSSMNDMPDLMELPVQQPRSRRTLEGEYLGIPIDTNARGDIIDNARNSVLKALPMKPQTYNGDEDWEAYLSHFEICAELGRWSHQDKALSLAACLRGNAQVYYMTLKPAERSSYHGLTLKLGQRFGNTRQQPMWISRLEARTRRPNESIAELGDDLRRLAQRAYSNMNHDAREMLALNQLYKSVSPELKYKCISDNCTSVTKAVTIIEMYEGILGAETGKRKYVRQVSANHEDSQASAGQVVNNTVDISALQGTIKQLQLCIERLTRQYNNQARGNQNLGDRNGSRLCYICLSPRHLQRNCPNNERNRRYEQPPQRQQQHEQPNYNSNQENSRPSTQ